MKIGFLFPGQGAQSVGMGKDLYEKYKKVRDVYDEAQKLTGVDIAKITFEGNEEELSQTKNTQIAILTMSLGILKVLQENGVKPEMAAGLSLGEYAALIAGNSISFENGIKIVQKRGEFMQEDVPAGNWSMVAILGLEDEEVEKACESVTSGFVVPANYNSVKQISISGDKEGVEAAVEKAKEMGATRTVFLNTSGPFHTEKLEEASKHLKTELDKIEIKTPEIDVIKNIDGTPYNSEDNMREILAEHVTHSVRFSKSIRYMLENRVDTFVEIGPRKNFNEFCKKNS